MKKSLESAPAEARRLMTWKMTTIGRVANGWSMNTDTMGVYGNYYLKRAMVTQLGLGANLPEDAIYPLNLFDDTGKPLDGANKYTLHFDKEATPPVNAFWSITLYDSEGFQVPNGSTVSRSAVTCRSRLTPTGHSTFTSKARAQAKTRNPTGCLRRRGRSTFACVSTARRPRPHRQMEPASGN